MQPTYDIFVSVREVDGLNSPVFAATSRQISGLVLAGYVVQLADPSEVELEGTIAEIMRQCTSP